ncbi:MAG: TadG family pilus assembly protein, partial [Planctomycetota bacterium]
RSLALGLTLALGASCSSSDDESVPGAFVVRSTNFAAASGAIALREGKAHEARELIRQVLGDNPVYGKTVQLADADVEFGLWDPVDQTFTPVPSSVEGTATAVRVTARLQSTDGTAIDSYFGGLVGYDSYDITRVSVAAIGVPMSISIDAKASPYLAGMSHGDSIPFTANSRLSWAPDASYYADCKPTLVEIDLNAGETVYFRDVDGSTGDHNSGQTYGLEGNLRRPRMAQEPVNGFDTTYAPLNSLMAVFLTNDRPTDTGFVPGLDFSTEAAREAETIAPLNKQIFFVGDGLRNDTGKLQKFTVPEGATRLFLGVSDEYGFWWDNFGNYRTTMFHGNVQIVN